MPFIISFISQEKNVTNSVANLFQTGLPTDVKESASM